MRPLVGNTVVVALPSPTDNYYRDGYEGMISCYHNFISVLAQHHPVTVMGNDGSKAALCALGNFTKGVEFELCDPPDIWVRDWFPLISATGKRVKAVYRPRYISRRRAKMIDLWFHKHIDFDHEIDLVIDGGNCVRSPDGKSAIMTGRIFSDNPSLSYQKVIDCLVDALELDTLIVIKSEPYQVCGHADGIVKYLSVTKLIINEKSSSYGKYIEATLATRMQPSMKIFKVPYYTADNSNQKFQSATGAYINCFVSNKVCVIPSFGNPFTDDKAITLFRAKSEVPVFQINCEAISRHGGCFNCITYQNLFCN